MAEHSDNLSRNLARLLPRLGNDVAVARLLGVKQSSVWRWRTGKTTPDAGHVEALSVAIGLSSAELRYGEHYAERRNDSTEGAAANR
jgi:DNA-binding transcriptional regulator YdaS (Cro superfamily)